MQKNDLRNNASINPSSLVRSHKNGICLANPEGTKRYNKHRLYSVKDLESFHFNTFLLNQDSSVSYANQATLETMNLASISDIIGRSMLNLSPKENALKIIKTDQVVIKTAQTKIIEDTVILKSGGELPFLTIKAPWYNNQNEVIGVFGCCIHLHSQPLAKSLLQIQQLGLLNSRHNNSSPTLKIPGSYINGIYLTKRQLEIANQLTRGKTAKSISLSMNLSTRTIEHYIVNLKHKLNVKSKSELTEFLIDHLSTI